MRKRGSGKMKNKEPEGIRHELRSTRITLSRQYQIVLNNNNIFANEIFTKVLGEVSREEAIEAIKKNFIEEMDKLK